MMIFDRKMASRDNPHSLNQAAIIENNSPIHHVYKLYAKVVTLYINKTNMVYFIERNNIEYIQ